MSFPRRSASWFRASDRAGIVYSSVRRTIGVNVVAYRPANILNVMQAYSYEIEVEALATIFVIAASPPDRQGEGMPAADAALEAAGRASGR